MDWCGIRVFIISCCLQSVLSSYLGYPRLHFAGQFRADTNTRNNDECNYRLDKPFNPDLNGLDWNVNGTNEFQFVDARITSVFYQDGVQSTTDPVVGQRIIGNTERPLAKIADISPNSGEHSTIFGLKFGIQWDKDVPDDRDRIAFHGSWTPSVLSQFVWTRMKCYSEYHNNSELYQDSLGQASQSITTLSDVDWSSMGDSEALIQLRNAANGNDLVVRVTAYYHTQNYPPYVARNATLGYVVGVIGVPSPSDTLNVPGERAMFFKNNPVGLTFDSDDLCYQQDISKYSNWTNFAPFEVDEERKEIRVDLSNSLPSDMFDSIRNIGTLRLGILTENCVYLLGDEEGLPYASIEDFPNTSAIYKVPVDDQSVMDMLASSPVVVAQVMEGNVGSSAICGAPLTTGVVESAQVLLQEYPYFIRPKGYYADALDRNSNPTSSQTMYVTKFGVPLEGVRVNAVLSNLPIPVDGVTPTSWSATTDEKGLVTFGFKMNEDVRIPLERHYNEPPCADNVYPDNRTTLPIDGQVYFFYYCVDIPGVNCDEYSYIRSYFLAHSDVEYVRPYTWVKDVGPILVGFARVSPVMSRILDMTSYANVTLPHNINLLNRTLRLDFYDASYMPTTRDLSPTKRNMILEWLEDPKFDESGSVPLEQAHVCVPSETRAAVSRVAEYFCPPRCSKPMLRFDTPPHDHDTFFNHILDLNTSTVKSADAHADLHRYVAGRPLYSGANCSVEGVKEQLQTAIELEWATIPVYLTSLYSIKDNCNSEIYNLTRSVIMQEMLHMTQSSNILIALNGSPLIDNVNVTPSFPTTGLPGGVLPKLRVTLEKLSLAHMYQVFMGIEVPQKSFVGYPIISNKTTIGVFYNEIKDCIDTLNNTLNNSIFNPLTLSRQVKWPWALDKQMGEVVPVTDTDSAKAGIDMIVSQGEGASILNPNQIGSDTLAHFFKFEEIVCQQHLVKVDKYHYAYNGAEIPFDSRGVWPMRANPKASTILPHTNCYTESRVFHQVYRMLLRKLQEVFNGRPDDIFVAVQLMESLQVHAKKLMWIKYHPDDPDDDTTCGPVWDYTWPED